MDTNHRKEVTLIFDGPAVEQHEIDIALLTETLSAFNSLAWIACKTIYGRGSVLQVKVKADFIPGSFHIDLILDTIVSIGQVAGAAVSIGTCIYWLIELYKRAKGSPVTENGRVGRDQVQVTNRDGVQITININTLKLYRNEHLGRILEKLTRALDKVGIDVISISTAVKDALSNIGKTLKLEKADRQIIKTKNEKKIMPVIQQIEDSDCLLGEEKEVTLNVITPNLSGKSLGWKFYDGKKEFVAIVKDTVFLDEVRRGKRSFSADGKLKVRIRKGPSGTPPRQIITQVLDSA